MPTCRPDTGEGGSGIEDLRLSVAQLDVEVDNPRARTLYERLGYREASRRPASWDVEDPDGSISRYETVVATLRKDLKTGGK